MGDHINTWVPGYLGTRYHMGLDPSHDSYFGSMVQVPSHNTYRTQRALSSDTRIITFSTVVIRMFESARRPLRILDLKEISAFPCRGFLHAV